MEYACVVRRRQHIFEIISRERGIDRHRGMLIGADAESALGQWLSCNLAWSDGELSIEPEPPASPHWNYQVRCDDQPDGCYRVRLQH